MAGNTEEVLHSGITDKTPTNIMFGAGTFHKGLTYGEHYTLTEDKTKQPTKTYYKISGAGGSGQGHVTYSEATESSFTEGTAYFEKSTGWNFKNTVIGATSGGTKLSIKPEFKDIEVDGAIVKVKGLAVKIGETATMESNLIELTTSMLKSAVVGQKATTSAATGYDEIVSVDKIKEGDYIENLGYVGETLEGKKVIVIFDNALCTSGLEVEGKNKEATVVKVTFECYADLTSNPVTLPYHIYYPTA